MNKRQVIVVGAGPSGSSAAYYLAQAGVDVLLVDKESWPRDKVCGDAQVAHCWDIYKEMDIFEEAHAAAYNHMTKFTFSGVKENPISIYHGVTRNADGSLDVKPFSFCTPRRVIDDIVRRAAVEKAGADFMENFEVTDLIIEKGYVKGVKAVYRNKPVKIFADAVVLANGSHSMQARQLGFFQEDPDLAWYGARAYFDNVNGMDIEAIEEHLPHKMFYPAEYMWVLPEGGKTANIGVFVTARELADSGMKLEDFFSWWRDNTKIGHERLGEARLLGEIKGWKLPSCRKVMDNTYNGCVLVGDAASAVECFTGEGFNEALHGGRQAGRVLAKALAEGDVSEERLSKYTRNLGEELNHYYGVMAATRDNIACDPVRYEQWLDYTRNLPDYPYIFMPRATMGFMKEVLGIDPLKK